MNATPQRSVGVTITAIVSILGSALLTLAGMLFQAQSLVRAARPNMTIHGGTVSPADIVVLRSVGAWGIATAVGLLRLRAWARWSTILFSGLLVAVGVFYSLIFAFSTWPIAARGKGAGDVVAFFCILLGASGGLWLYYFHTSGAKAQFGARVGGPGDRPLSVWFIGWFLIIGGLFYFTRASLHLPIRLFAWVFGGVTARIMYLVFAAIDCGLGLVLLRLRPVGRILAIALCAFSILNCLVFALLPGYAGRMGALREMMRSRTLFDMRPALLAEALAWLIAMYFLIARRSAFRSEQISSQQPL